MKVAVQMIKGHSTQALKGASALFGFGKWKKTKQQRSQSNDDRKLQEMMNEVSGELGIDKDGRSAQGDSTELGKRLTEEVRKRNRK
ncbi:hypothetical protein SAMN05444487_101260 [Marininema mesophilum]|uniref:Uncharacterized protein n=1 Tax=Marininema mesophilum TaxID=1048340 RepID=A0A1H2QM77_9BACL|nr:hypothetical protein [Marininema mesophilum]SDW08256.1 hypothetical protein SAMN05444487_101260 [Marininema mesophilum]